MLRCSSFIWLCVCLAVLPSCRGNIGHSGADGEEDAANGDAGDAGSDQGADAGADPGSDPGSDPGADQGSDPGADPGADTGADNGADPGADPGLDGGDEGPARVLFFEPFEDTNFEARGWYDGPSGELSTDEHIDGSASSFMCYFEQGASGCRGGTPGRHLFDESETVFLSYWVKYSDNYVGSQRTYHPHEFHFVTNKDGQWVGPASTHLTTYTEQVGGVVRIALQDSRNVDLDCILLNNDSFVGCDGDFDTYQFTEERSVCSCNGLVGDLDGRDCFPSNGGYYSARFWDSEQQMFSDDPGPRYKNDWHFIESYFQMNTIQDGVGIPDGVIQYWYDGELIIDYHHILMRTGQHPDMRFNQFLIAPYIGDGSPADQIMWVDDLTVATGR